MTAGGVRRCCRENRWGAPPRALVCPRPGMEAPHPDTPPCACASLGACRVLFLPEGAVCISVAAGGPCGVLGRKAGPRSPAGTTGRPTERLSSAQLSAHPAADRAINLLAQLPALLQILSPPQSLWNPARASSCPSPTTFYQHLGPEWPQGLRAADRTKPAQTNASPSPRGTGPSQATGPAAPLGCLLSWAQGQSCI